MPSDESSLLTRLASADGADNAPALHDYLWLQKAAAIAGKISLFWLALIFLFSDVSIF